MSKEVEWGMFIKKVEDLDREVSQGGDRIPIELIRKIDAIHFFHYGRKSESVATRDRFHEL